MASPTRVTRRDDDPEAAVAIALLEPGDEAALTELFRANDIPEVTQFFDPFPLDEDSARRLCHYAGRDCHWGIWLGQRLVGLIMVRGWDDGHPHPALGALVDRHITGSGIASAAFKLVVAELRAQGEPVLRSRIHDHNEVCVLGTQGTPGWREVSRGEGRVVFEYDVTGRLR